MHNADHIVASWLEGSDSEAGLANPAGPLYAGGVEPQKAGTEGTAGALQTKPIFCDISTITNTCFG